MKKTKIQTVYNSQGKTNIRNFVNKSGVYIIYDKNKEVKYVGYSVSNLYKTCLRHFQSWKDRSQYRATFPKDYLVRIIICTPTQAARLEAALIERLKPTDNVNIIPLFPKTTLKKVLVTYEESEFCPF
jgi:excinuclease UvrABC nuclease subunit